MTSEAFRYYLPAYLLVSIIHYRKADAIPDGVVFILTPPSKDGESMRLFRRLVKNLTPNEKAVIRKFLEFMKTIHGEDYPDRLPNRALNRYWHKF
jgi:hypothetical protein